MNTNLEEGLDLILKLKENYKETDPKMIVIPPYTHLVAVNQIIKDSPIQLGAQNVHQESKGAYTGAISIPMLQSIGVDYVILGHSERRQYFHETDDLLAKKSQAVIKSGMTPIYCVGEPIEIRTAQGQNAFVEKQLQDGLFHLSAEEFSKIIIAYEPIWAIGTGLTASPEQAQDMHAFIRHCISKKYNQALADSITILYGGSVKGSNARDIFVKPDVDGALVGGASLDAVDFLKIAQSF